MCAGIPQEDWAKEMGELTNRYVSRLKLKLSEIESLIELGNWEEVSKLAHQIAGSAGSYGFDAVAVQARLLEKHAGVGTTPAMKKHFKKMFSLMEKYWE